VAARLPAKAEAGNRGGAAEKPQAQEMLLRRSVAAVTSAKKLGDFFQYVVVRPVTLPR
jgi:hypothetical protein